MKTNKPLIIFVVIFIAFALSACQETATPILPTITHFPTFTQSPTITPSPTATATPLPTNTPIPSPTPTPSPLPPSEIAKSTVRIDVLKMENSRFVPVGHGSGTIITSDGVILTNAHVVADAAALQVSIISDIDQPPEPTYFAEVIEIDYVLDLALIQITTDLEHNEVIPSELGLQALAIGDSDDIDLGQNINIIGYPGTGGETVTFTKGIVSGFQSEDLGNGTERIWIKTDTDISYGNSGGSAINEQAKLVGVPTAGQGSELDTLGYLRPIDLSSYLLSGSCAPLICEALIYEPNDEPITAYGPIDSKTSHTAYLHQYDVDFYSIDVKVPEPIMINLRDIPKDVDYDLGLFVGDSLETLSPLVISDGENTSSEYILFTPTFTGTFYIAVFPYQGYSLQKPYTLQSSFNGDVDELGNISVRGRLVDLTTGEGIKEATIMLLLPDVTVDQFIKENGDKSFVQSESITDDESVFVLENVPRGKTYSVFIILENNYVWQDDWLTINDTDPDVIDVGDIQVNFQ
jgi:S1-C subfamily serine protease